MDSDSSSIVSPPFRNRSRDHRWVGVEAITIMPGDSLTGCQETHRTCPDCGCTKVTVHQPDGKDYRAYRLPNGDRWPYDARPACVKKSP